jgi:hypothetical protein
MTDPTDFLERAEKEYTETVQQMAGIGGAEVAGAFAGLMVSAFRELFERLEVVERALLVSGGAQPTAPIHENVQPQGAQPVREAQVQAREHPQLAPPQTPEPIPVTGVAAYAPPTEEQLRVGADSEIAQLESRLRALRERRGAAPSTLAPPGAIRYEVRHADGPLSGRSDVLQALVFHDTYTAAQQASLIIQADHPGWRDRLTIVEVQR